MLRLLCRAGNLAFIVVMVVASASSAGTISRVARIGGFLDELRARAEAGRRGRSVPAVRLDLPVRGGRASFALLPHAGPRGVGHGAVIVTERGQEPDPTAVTLFSAGGNGGDFVRLALVGDGELYGVMRRAGSLYTLTTGPRSAAREPSLTIEETTADELRAAVTRCAVDAVDVPSLAARGGAPRAAADRRVVRLAIEADHAFFLTHGPGTNAVVLVLIDAVNAIYERLDVQLEVVFQRAWAIPDPYLDTVGGEALTRLRTYWEGVELPAHPTWSAANPGLVQLLQGAPSPTSIVGLAYVGGVCSDTRFSVVDAPRLPFAIQTVVSAHELGHNFGLGHVGEQGSIMSPGASATTTWAKASIDAFAVQRGQLFGLVDPAAFDTCLIPASQTTHILQGRVVSGGDCPEGVGGVTIDGGALGTRVTSVSGEFSFGAVAGDLSVALTPQPLQGGDVFAPASFSHLFTQGDAVFTLTHPASSCGDGQVDAGEDCDAGADACGSCCDALCRFRPALAVCREAAGACDTAEVCSGAAAACPTAAPRADGSACDEGDPCHLGAVCAGGACSTPTVQQVEGCLDRFLCYRSNIAIGTPKPPGGRVVLLDDALEGAGSPAVYQPKTLTTLCAPTGPLGSFVQGYKISRLGGRFAPQMGVRTADRFGTLTLDALKPAGVLVAATVSTAPPDPVPPPWGVLDQYKCYKVKPALGAPRFQPQQVTLEDAGQQALLAEVRKPKSLCVPVDEGGATRSRVGHLLCYQAKRVGTVPPPALATFRTANYLDVTQVTTLKEGEVCVPAVRIP